MNRTGARLMGIRPQRSGTIAFLLGSLLAAVSGILIAPVNTIFYDSGFLIGLKAFVGAIIGGLVSFPVTAIGSVFVGILESFAAFLSSPFKEVIVFSILIPVLLWRSYSLRADRGGGRGMSARTITIVAAAAVLALAGRAALPGAVHDHADELHRRLFVRRARPRPADRHRRHGVVRPGLVHGHRRLCDGLGLGADGLLAVARPGARRRRDLRRRRHPRPR